MVVLQVRELGTFCVEEEEAGHIRCEKHGDREKRIYSGVSGSWRSVDTGPGSKRSKFCYANHGI